MKKIVQRLEQKQKFNLKQILESNLMQLNLDVLEKRILEEIESNPTLEVVEEEVTETDSDENNDDFNWEDLVSNPEDFSLSKNKEVFDLSQNSENLSLVDDFISQLNDLNASEKELEIAELVLGNLDERGYLKIEPIVLADKLNVSEKNILALINKVQLLEPAGIGSMNLQQCILAQLRTYYPKETLAFNIIKDCFDEFKNNNFIKIIEKMKCSSIQLSQVQNLISVLNPSPGLKYSYSNIEHVVPDILADKQKGKWHVVGNSTYIPKLRLNKNYQNMFLDKKTTGNVKNFLKQKISSANLFIDAVSNRYATIVKIMYSIIKHQKKYFESSTRVLEPLILKTIAEDINMDLSTISRATNGKYVQLPWGCVELKSFFSEGILTKSGKIISNTVVKEKIKSFIDNEDIKDPLTDEDIMEKLLSIDYIIARRTIAKYRESMKIPISRLRKKII